MDRNARIRNSVTITHVFRNQHVQVINISKHISGNNNDQYMNSQTVNSDFMENGSGSCVRTRRLHMGRERAMKGYQKYVNVVRLIVIRGIKRVIS